MATQQLEVYKCDECGVVIEVVRGGGDALVCGNQTMRLLTENTTDAAQEKHVPVVEKIDGGVKVTVGEVAHPMAEEHWIEWIEAIADGVVSRKILGPGEPPEAVFPVTGEQVTVRALCNLHGLWKSN